MTIAIVLFACISAALGLDEFCHHIVATACSSQSFSGSSICNARYGGIEHVEPELQAYANSQLRKSYEYLLLATNFNSYQKNRPGFQKLYQGFSDRSFEDTIDLIKQVSRRGGKHNFETAHESPATISTHSLKLEVDELQSLAIALDNEKQLADAAIHVHNIATHTSSGKRDPEVGQYLEEKFLTSLAKTVRQLSGYSNDLAKFMKQQDPSVAIYLFDEYLSKA